jgi:branched-chain amino acid transport system ATP-binding protein
MTADAPVLEVRGLVAGYDGVPVVHGIDLHVDTGEVVVLLGANGAGKSTTLQTISGLLPPLDGEVRYGGTVLWLGRRRGAAAAAEVARSGLLHVPEDRGLFSELTVDEHLRLARPRRDGSDLVDDVLGRFPALQRLSGRRAGLLSGGEQQMLALAKALVARPRVLLVDELSLGLAPLIVRQLLPVLREIADDHQVGVLLVEQHVGLALAVADRGTVLRRGRVVMEGPAAHLRGRLDELEAGYFDEAPNPGG